MNKRNLVIYLLPTIIAGNFSIVSYANENIVEESDKDIQIKEFEKTDEHVLLSINCNDNVKSVRLPNGNWVNNNEFNYAVNRNGSYDFVYKATNGETKVVTENVTGLRTNYLITPKEDVLLKLSSQDLLSGMGSMKFKNEANGQWTNYEDYKTSKDWRLDSVEGLKTVYVTYKDIAGNESTEVFDKIILDKSGPEITQFTINNDAPYTKNRNVTLNINAIDNFSEVSKLLISNDNQNWTEVSYNNTVPWTLTPGSGNKTVYLKAIDSLGNVGQIATDSIYFDDVIPTGTISINNGATITNSRNVKLQLSFGDAHSGVKRVSIIEKDKIYNFPSVPNSPTEIDWTLSHGATGQVTLEVEDNAGNVYRTNSNVITIATLEITQFRLTNVVNPALFPTSNPFKPLTWTFAPQEMKSGANISFDINYKLDLDDKTQSVINGDYYIEVIGENGYHKVIQAKYDNAINNGFEATVTLPNDAPVDAKVYLSSKIEATLTNSTETFKNEAFFPGKGERALIGIIKGNIKEDIIFNEIS